MTDQRLATTYGDAAQHNRAAFDATLEGYVGQKLAYSLKRLGCGESEVWFEPPKSLTTDLQSAPFGHSGIPPYEILELVDGFEPPTC